MKIIFPFFIFIVLIFTPQLVGATSLSPSIIDLKLDPGSATTVEIKLYNETTEDVYINGSIEKFVPKGDHGEAETLPFTITDASVNWIKLPTNSLVLKPGEEVSVPVIISVPSTADIGGYYLAVMWESSAGPKLEKSHQTLISSRIGSLVLLEVNGSTDSNLELVDVGITGDKKIYASSDLNFYLKLRNPGNVHQRPQGSIIIKNFFGKTIDILPINFEKSAILPNMTRIFETNWQTAVSEPNIEPNFMTKISHGFFGRYSAKYIVDYGDNKSLISNPIYFWIIPWTLLLVILVSVLLMYLIIRFIKKRLKNI